jgi:glycosyltransferase involved in cell wall biosynthesis
VKAAHDLDEACHGKGEVTMRETISCAIVVYNEERNIAECLESANWMDEIMVVDAYSQDKTVEICRKFTPCVYQRPWNGFGEQKNFAIDHATSDWVFILDADERISPALRNEIEAILTARNPVGPVAYSLPRKNFYYGKWIRWAGCYPDTQLRLFRRGVGRLDDAEPHNKFVFQGLGGNLQAALDHYTERTIEDHFRKFNNFTTLAARERAKTKSSVSWADLTLRPIFTFWKYYVRRQGFREGMHGLLICAFASMYTFVKYAKLWDMTRQVAVSQDLR